MDRDTVNILKRTEEVGIVEEKQGTVEEKNYENFPILWQGLCEGFGLTERRPTPLFDYEKKFLIPLWHNLIKGKKSDFSHRKTIVLPSSDAENKIFPVIDQYCSELADLKQDPKMIEPLGDIFDVLGVRGLKYVLFYIFLGQGRLMHLFGKEKMKF